VADVSTIAKAQLAGVALNQVFGEQPAYDYQSDYVRVYYEPDRLKQVQSRIEQMAVSGPSDVRIDWLPMVTPFALKKATPYIIGIAAAGFLLGRMFK
jgi:hypothetical protein